MNEANIVETRDRDGNRVWVIRFANGTEHPAYFSSKLAALWQFGMLRSGGYREGVRAA